MTYLNPILPKIDLHRHLEGSVRPATVIEISRKHHLPLPAWDETNLEPYINIQQPTADITLLLPKFDLLRQVFVDEDACRRVTIECLEDANSQQLDYVELRFSPLFMAEPHGLDAKRVTAAVCEGLQEANSRLSTRSSLICILSRTYGPERCQVELDCALAFQRQGVVGIDLAGDEARQPAKLFCDHFTQARNAGLMLTAHAGEFRGADSVRETIAYLQPTRLGHAVHAADDPAVMDLINHQDIAVECCPTSNYLTTSVPSLRQHPLPKFLQWGIRATINTDDPSLMGHITLEDEYRVASEEMGCTKQQLETVQRNAALAAFASL